MSCDDSFDFEVRTGCQFDQVFIWKDDVGALIDLTDYTALMTLKVAHSDELATLELTDGAGITLGGVTGEISVHLTAAQTEVLAGSYIYSILLTAPTEDPEHFISGRVNIQPVVHV